MENTQLAWSDISSFAGLTSELGKGKLGLILLVSGKDSKSCCAANFERTLFRAPKVVKYAKKSLAAYRLDRTHGAGKEFYAKFELKSTIPAVLVVDEHGDLLYKTQYCTEPRHCLTGMQVATLLTKKRAAYTPTATKKFKSAFKNIKGKQYRDALITLGKINKKYLTAPLTKKLDRYYKKVESDAKKKLKLARRYENKNDLERASEIYKDASREFSRLKKVRARARAGLKRVLKKREGQKNRA